MAKLKKEEIRTLVDSYAMEKDLFETQKATCDKLNKQIKEIMTGAEVSELEGNTAIATLVIQNRESVDEEKMLEVLKADWIKTHGTLICPYIKTKYYVDMDELESAIYKGEVDADTLTKLESCRNKTQVQTLRIKKRRV